MVKCQKESDGARDWGRKGGGEGGRLSHSFPLSESLSGDSCTWGGSREEGEGCVVSLHTDGYHRGGCRPEDQHVQIEGWGKEKKTRCYFLERHLVLVLITTADRKLLLVAAGCRLQDTLLWQNRHKVVVDKTPNGPVSTAFVLLLGTHNVLRLLSWIKTFRILAGLCNTVSPNCHHHKTCFGPFGQIQLLHIKKSKASFYC